MARRTTQRTTQVKRIKITKDKVPQVMEALQRLLSRNVLVGIPESKASRTDGEGATTNAQIGYIQEFGAPGANIPPRPFLIPGVKESLRAVAPQLKAAAKEALDGKGSGAADGHLQAAGMIAASSVKARIGSNIPPPLKPSTIRSRKYDRQTQSRRGSEREYLSMVKDGMSSAEAQSASGIRTLINTGQLRNSITWVIRKNGQKVVHVPQSLKGKSRTTQGASSTSKSAPNQSHSDLRKDTEAAARSEEGTLLERAEDLLL